MKDEKSFAQIVSEEGLAPPPKEDRPAQRRTGFTHHQGSATMSKAARISEEDENILLAMVEVTGDL